MRSKKRRNGKGRTPLPSHQKKQIGTDPLSKARDLSNHNNDSRYGLAYGNNYKNSQEGNLRDHAQRNGDTGKASKNRPPTRHGPQRSEKNHFTFDPATSKLEQIQPNFWSEEPAPPTAQPVPLAIPRKGQAKDATRMTSESFQKYHANKGSNNDNKPRTMGSTNKVITERLQKRNKFSASWERKGIETASSMLHPAQLFTVSVHSKTPPSYPCGGASRKHANSSDATVEINTDGAVKASPHPEEKVIAVHQQSNSQSSSSARNKSKPKTDSSTAFKMKQGRKGSAKSERSSCYVQQADRHTITRTTNHRSSSSGDSVEEELQKKLNFVKSSKAANDLANAALDKAFKKKAPLDRIGGSSVSGGSRSVLRISKQNGSLTNGKMVRDKLKRKNNGRKGMPLNNTSLKAASGPKAKVLSVPKTWGKDSMASRDNDEDARQTRHHLQNRNEVDDETWREVSKRKYHCANKKVVGTNQNSRRKRQRESNGADNPIEIDDSGDDDETISTLQLPNTTRKRRKTGKAKRTRTDHNEIMLVFPFGADEMKVDECANGLTEAKRIIEQATTNAQGSESDCESDDAENPNSIECNSNVDTVHGRVQSHSTTAAVSGRGTKAAQAFPKPESSKEALSFPESEVFQKSNAVPTGKDNGGDNKSDTSTEQDGMIFSKPAPGKMKTRAHFLTVREEDFDRLEEGEFLNDTLIDFWMQWLMRKEDREKSPVHVFSSHFYTSLSEDGPDAVQSWTARKNVDIFSKRFVFIPINKSLHWSLCVVVNPGDILRRSKLLMQSGDDTLSDKEANSPISCIIFFDSLKAHAKSEVARNVRKWLNAEWQRTKISPVNAKPFTPGAMAMIEPRIPYQNNSWDCGVFVCRYAYALFMRRHEILTFRDYLNTRSRPFKDAITKRVEFQFNMSDIERIREEMKTLITNLATLYKAHNAGLLKAKKRVSEEAAKDILTKPSV